MTIDATFWVAISFFIFFGVLIYLKVPQKINIKMTNQINEIKKELDNAEKLKEEAKNKSKEEIIAKTESEQIKIEEEKMKTLETLEEDEQRLK